jgi:hypothetical protein
MEQGGFCGRNPPARQWDYLFIRIGSESEFPRSVVVTSIGGLKARFIQDGSGLQPWPDFDE